jgi:hypothetical protein
MAAHELSGDSPRIPVGQGLEVGIDVRPQLLHHEVVPVTGRQRIDAPGASQRSIHIDGNEDELVDHARCDRPVKEALRILVVEKVAIACERIGKKVNHGIPLWGFVITRRQIDDHLAYRARANFVLGQVDRLNLRAHHFARRGSRLQWRRAQGDKDQESECTAHAGRDHGRGD